MSLIVWVGSFTLGLVREDFGMILNQRLSYHVWCPAHIAHIAHMCKRV